MRIVKVCHLGNSTRRLLSVDAVYIGQLITFDMVHDDVLLHIFEFYVDEDTDTEKWITLVHVCRRWRSLVFQSPRHLNLRLDCTPKKRARDILDIWPPLPLIVRDCFEIFPDISGVVNTIAALKHNDRVSQIDLDYFPFEYVESLAVLQKPFPELTHLKLGMTDHRYGRIQCDGPIFPDSFLGGSTPRLRSLVLSRIPFPAIPNLLLSTTHLVDLKLYDIPSLGYISPEVMATSLSALTRLNFLHLHFRFEQHRTSLEGRRPPPLTRSILPNLTTIQFRGDSEYLEKLLAWIDAPQVKELCISFFNQFLFDTPQLFQFISRRPTLIAPKRGHMTFSSNFIMVKLPSQTSDYGALVVDIPCSPSELRRLSSFQQVCTSSLPSLFTLEDLYIRKDPFWPPFWQDDVENTSWLQLLRPFATVKNLYLDEEFAPRFASALQELVGRRSTEVLPTLENIFLEGLLPSGPLHEDIEKFVATRQLIGHFVAISRWDRDLEQEKSNYWERYCW